MKSDSSRRRFLTTGLALPAAGMAGARRRSPAVQSPPQLASDKAPEPRYRTLGSTGLKLTAVGMGCMITSDPIVIERAADIGINYFDTARSYQSGNNERMVGGALKSKRKDVILSTKTHSSSKSQALEDLETSLKELGTDYVDIWYVHARSRPEQITDEMVEAFETAKKQGKTRFCGFSTHRGQKQMLRAAAGNPHIDVVLAAYNFTMDEEMTEAVEFARKAGKGVIAMKVMAGGFRRIKPGNPLYDKLQQEGTMVAALKWVLSHENIDSTAPASRTWSSSTRTSAPCPLNTPIRTARCLPGNWTTSVRSTAGCAAPARAGVPRACRSPTSCATSPTRKVTGSSNWLARTSSSCPAQSGTSVAPIVRNA